MDTSVASYFLYAVVGYCGTQPSVELYRFLAKLLKDYVPPKEPEPSPVALNAKRFGFGMAGGLLGGVLFQSNPPYAIGASLAFGRIASDIASFF